MSYNAYPPQPSYGQPPPPSCPPPWRAMWDSRDNRYYFENTQTGEKSWDFPQGHQSNAQYYSQGPPRQEYKEQKQGHHWGGAALGVAAGLAGGALLMHEGHEVKEKWEEVGENAERKWDDARDDVRYDERRAEYDVDRFGDRVEYDAGRAEERVEDFPDDAARWAGRQEQRIDDIPENMERRWDNAVDDVEDAPERVAGWFGRQDQKVEDFGDDLRDNYDAGREEQRYDDDRRDDW